MHGTRNDYRQVYRDDYLLVDGLHEPLVSEEVNPLSIDRMERGTATIFIMDVSIVT